MNTIKVSLTFKVLVGMILGIIFGLVINILELNTENSFINLYIINGLFHIMGQMFITALKMLVVPLVFFSLITGVLGIGSIKSLGRAGIKSFGLYLFTTAIAIAIAIFIAVTFDIGKGVNMDVSATFSAKNAPSISEVIVGIIPGNIVDALASGNMLQIIFFSILVGISILLAEKKAKSIINIVEAGNEIMIKMVNIVMIFAPYAIFALLAKALANIGLDLLLDLASYVLVLIAALAFHLYVVLMIILKVFTNLNPYIFLKKMRDTQIYAFSTSSSNVVIPITLRTITKKLGVDNSIASFSIPLGATINMDGTAIMQGVATIFIANIFNIDLNLTSYLVIIFMAVLASIGTVGVPSSGLIMLTMVFEQVGLPVEGIALILGVDRLLDMIRTAVNVSGDAVVSIIVAKSENKFNENIYNSLSED